MDNKAARLHRPNRETPIYKSIIEDVRRQVAEGALRPGSRLPTTRALARSLGVDPNTVARAYSLLEHEGLLEARPGRGTYVAADPAVEAVAEARDEPLRGLFRRAIQEGGSLGHDAETLSAVFKAELDRWRGATERRSLHFAGSHDDTLEMLWALANRWEPGLRVRSSTVGSLWGLVALERGDAHLAGSHLLDPETGEYNLPWIRTVLPGRQVVLLRLGEREQGLMYRDGYSPTPYTLRDVARSVRTYPRVRFVNRQRGSGTRVLLDRELRRLGIDPRDIEGYEREEQTHSAVATAVANGDADVGLGLRSAARLLGLDFTPVAQEAYDLVTFAETLSCGTLEPVVTALGSAEFRALLEATGGYNTSDTGRVTTICT